MKINLKNILKSSLYLLLPITLTIFSAYQIYATTNEEISIKLNNNFKSVYQHGEDVSLSGVITPLIDISEISIKVFINDTELQINNNTIEELNADSETNFDITSNIPQNLEFGSYTIKVLFVDDKNEVLDMIDKEIFIANSEAKSSNNINVYIQPKSELTFSLDTNSITFNDFDGLKDIVNDEAITLTISSILPYEVNTYLESEISNKDNTKTMDKNIFKIKSSQVDYQSFDAVNSKIKLLDIQNPSVTDIHKIGLMLQSGIPYETDTYKAIIKFEVVQK